jgi:adenylosuccinate lyase
MFGEELLRGCTVLEQLMQTYPARGIKGAVGTQLDLVTLLGGDSSKIEEFDQRMRDFLGLPGLLGAVGQVYPRSLDFEVVSALFQATSAPSSFARTLRLMAGHELASEGFAKGQVGSSAMPHKMNSRSCERINGFHAILRGHVTMASSLAGDQWNEGDVSCSVVRRAVLPDSFFAADGLLETFLTVLGQMEVFPALIEMENRRYFPFLSTTTILMESVKAGVGRESAHAAIKEHAVATVKNLRSGQITENDLVKRLAEDARLGLSETALQEIVENAAALLGNAEAQVDDFQSRVKSFVARHPNAKNCVPEPLL